MLKLLKNTCFVFFSMLFLIEVCSAKSLTSCRKAPDKNACKLEHLKSIKNKLKTLEGKYEVVLEDGSILEMTLVETTYQKFLENKASVSEERMQLMYGRDYTSSQVESDGFRYSIFLNKKGEDFAFEKVLTEASFSSQTRRWLLSSTKSFLIERDLISFSAIYDGKSVSWKILLNEEGKMLGLELSQANSDLAGTILFLTAPLERTVREKSVTYQVIR